MGIFGVFELRFLQSLFYKTKRFLRARKRTKKVFDRELPQAARHISVHTINHPQTRLHGALMPVLPTPPEVMTTQRNTPTRTPQMPSATQTIDPPSIPSMGGCLGK